MALPFGASLQLTVRSWRWTWTLAPTRRQRLRRRAISGLVLAGKSFASPCLRWGRRRLWAVGSWPT